MAETNQLSIDFILPAEGSFPWRWYWENWWSNPSASNFCHEGTRGLYYYI